jgi:hypothetical protein
MSKEHYREIGRRINLTQHPTPFRETLASFIFTTTCYLGNGHISPGAVPCDNNAVLQARNNGCCNQGDLCLSNDLCRNPSVNNMTNYVCSFGCTDKTFEDAACENYCGKFTREWDFVSYRHRQLLTFYSRSPWTHVRMSGDRYLVLQQSWSSARKAACQSNEHGML